MEEVDEDPGSFMGYTPSNQGSHAVCWLQIARQYCTIDPIAQWMPTAFVMGKQAVNSVH